MNDWPALPCHRRAGSPVVFDPCRKILIPSSPEEDVRQRFVSYLSQELGIPPTALYTEQPLSAWSGGGRGRVDIVSWVQIPSGERTLLLVECKAPHVVITDDTFDQLARYDDDIGADYLAITNGTLTEWYRYDPEQECHELIEGPPTFEEMLAGSGPDVLALAAPPHRPAFGDVGRRARELLLENAVLGEGSPGDHHEYLFNLGGLFQFDPGAPLRDWTTLNLIDVGERFTEFGNAAGGKWPGRYRYFHIEDEVGDSQIVSMAVLGKMMTTNDPRFGNANGHTILVVAVDDFETRHSSLQLDLDRFVRRNGRLMDVWHDGTLTHGKRGPVKRAEVMTHIAKRDRSLLRGSEIFLGSFPADRSAAWADVSDLTERIARYALLRTDLRRTR